MEQLPGLMGRLNLIRDRYDRTYLYASTIAINEGCQQPVRFESCNFLSVI